MSLSHRCGAPILYPLPRVLVFDLDGTFWSPEMYELWHGGGAPFSPVAADRLCDKSGTAVSLLSDTQSIIGGLYRLLHEARSSGQDAVPFIVAAASTSDEPDWARECLRKFKIAHPETGKFTVPLGDVLRGFDHIYGSNKSVHMANILKNAGKVRFSSQGEHDTRFDKPLTYDDFIFFDNQTNNVHDCGRVGVHSVYTPSGLTKQAWEKGVREWRARSKF